jgi:hypothetical protein
MSPDPVSWFVVEPGWRVLDANGEEVGAVDEVTGDSGKDIFDGLAIESGLFSKPRYVPSELVGQILDGEIHLTIDKARVEQLAEYKEPPSSEEILPEKASIFARAEGALVYPTRSRELRVPFLRRVRVRLDRLFRGRR